MTTAQHTPRDVLAELSRLRLLPVLTVASETDARMLRDGFLTGGLGVAEVTLRTEAALDAIRVLADGGVLVGAGTVLSVADAERAMAAGASFLVSPGTAPALLEWGAGHGVTVIPGVATPTEALTVRDFGITVAKLFPASVVGGPAWLRAVAAPIPDLRFIATGGVIDAALPDYLSTPNLLAVGGSWFLPTGQERTVDDIAAGVRAVLERIAVVTG